MIIESALRCLPPLVHGCQQMLQCKPKSFFRRFSFNENSDLDDIFAIFSKQCGSNCMRRHIFLPILNIDIESPSLADMAMQPTERKRENRGNLCHDFATNLDTVRLSVVSTYLLSHQQQLSVAVILFPSDGEMMS